MAKLNVEQIKKDLKRWYSFNFQNVAIFITLIGTVMYTTTMPTHINTVYNLLSELSAFYMFMLMLLSIIQIFTVITYAKKRSPFGIILTTLVTILILFFAYKYVTIIGAEVRDRADLIMEPYMANSRFIISFGAVMFVIATIYNWFIVNWKYVKEVE